MKKILFLSLLVLSSCNLKRWAAEYLVDSEETIEVKKIDLELPEVEYVNIGTVSTVRDTINIIDSTTGTEATTIINILDEDCVGEVEYEVKVEREVQIKEVEVEVPVIKYIVKEKSYWWIVVMILVGGLIWLVNKIRFKF